MRILITGSRNHPDRSLVWRAILGRILELDELITIVHGDCPTGADQHAADLCPRFLLVEEAHPADWDKHGKAAGPIRNQQMVDLGADVCLAFPYGESRGTRDCARRAEAAGIPVVWCYVPGDEP